MKKYLLFILMVLGSFTLANAQVNNPQKGEKVQALKIAFLTQRLQLTPEEAQKFWPVYNKYEAEVHALRMNKKDGDVLENEEKLLGIRKKYKPKFEKILGASRMNALYNAERDFRNILIKGLKSRNQKRSH